MTRSFQYQFCPSCGNQTPLNNFCIYCGAKIQNIGKCQNCNALIPRMINFCPFCGKSDPLEPLFDLNRKSRFVIKQQTWIRPAILLIFFISLYSLSQFLIGTLLIPFFPSELTTDSPEYFSFNLITLFIANILLIGFIVKFLTNSDQKVQDQRRQINILLFLALILIATISLIEIFITIVDYGLNLIELDPVESSPYDNYFDNVVNIILFMLLAVFAGPIYEELVYRRITLSILSTKTQSEILPIIIGALIFSLSHTPADLLEGSVRYSILHFIATICLGIILSIIFLKWGLKYSIIFHSSWNVFSIIIQLLSLNNYLILIDFIILTFMGITTISIILFLLKFRRSIKFSLFKVKIPDKPEFLIILINFFLIIMYELIIPLVLFSIEQNIITAVFILVYVFSGVFIGILLINKEKRVYGKFILNR